VNTVDIAKIAAGITAGDYAAEEVSELCGGDENLIGQVLGVAAGMGGGTIAAQMTETLLTGNVVGRTVCDVGDAAIDTVCDVAGALNPFSW
jgi:hypothetical protein